MAIQDALKDLQEFDFNNLDVENIGSWPIAVKAIIWALVFIGILFAGYSYEISPLQDQLTAETDKEVQLKQEFETKAFKAANLDAYRKQMKEMDESFSALLSQLPTDTEVPGLLEDITNRGVENGLEIVSINLQPEQAKDFYIELPIEIVVKGSYHDIGAFVSGISGLPRIVTLHDFSIAADKEAKNGVLTMTITAKTYRYKGA
jgi:type IV pilus assembly protein PilO